MGTMPDGPQGVALRDVRTLFQVGTVGDLTDGQLLERFRAGTGEVAELAFAALVERHGPMVLRTCRLVLRDHHDAHDAFQATFLVLVRRAGSLWVRDSLGAWLHQVAYRTASGARADTIRRLRHERKAAEAMARPVGDVRGDDLAAIVHEEIARLPDRYRATVVLCLLEGLTHEQAAARLGCPTGTVRSRLARGRERLRGRLTGRGLVPSVAAWGAIGSAEVAEAGVPAGLAQSAVRSAVRLAVGGEATAEAVSASVASLADGVLRTMLMTRLKAIAAALLIVGGVATGAGVLAQQGEDEVRRSRPAPDVRTRRLAVRSERLAARTEAEVLTLPGPPEGQRMIIRIEGPGDATERLTLEPAGSGRFLVRREFHRKGDRISQEMICSSIEVSALHTPEPNDRVYPNPLDRPRVENVAPAPDPERRLRKMEQTLEQILKVLESRRGEPSPDVAK